MLKKIISDRLIGNSIWLILDTAIVTLLGFAFWTINARLFSTEQVGLATALITAVELLVALSMLGFDVALIRYLPSLKDNKLVSLAFTVGGGLSLLLGVIFVLFINFFSPELDILYNPIKGGLFVLFLFFAFGFKLLDSVFIAQSKSKYVLIKNAIFSVIKIILPLFLVAYGAYAIFSSWMIGIVISFFISIRWASTKIKPVIEKKVAQRIWKFSSINFITNFLILAPQTILTLMITNILGPEFAAYFYMAWMMSMILFVIPNAVSKSLLAESSRTKVQWKNIKKAITFSYLLVIPGVVIFVTLSRYILLIFGPEYSVHAQGLLDLIAVSAIPITINAIYVAVMNAKQRIDQVLLINSLITVATLGLSYLTLHLGLIMIGYSWLASQLAVAIPLSVRMWGMRNE